MHNHVDSHPKPSLALSRRSGEHLVFACDTVVRCCFVLICMLLQVQSLLQLYVLFSHCLLPVPSTLSVHIP